MQAVRSLLPDNPYSHSTAAPCLRRGCQSCPAASAWRCRPRRPWPSLAPWLSCAGKIAACGLNNLQAGALLQPVKERTPQVCSRHRALWTRVLKNAGVRRTTTHSKCVEEKTWIRPILRRFPQLHFPPPKKRNLVGAVGAAQPGARAARYAEHR
eukprot:355617-Chlamydomonas_euryale.AAC.9